MTYNALSTHPRTTVGTLCATQACLTRTRTGCIRLTLLVALIWCGLLLPAAAQDANSIRNPQSSVDNRTRSVAHVDPVTLAMQLEVPLGDYQGRGLSLPLTLRYSSKVWTIKYILTDPCAPAGEVGEPDTIYEARFGRGSAAGWTSSLDWFGWPVDATFETYDGITGKPAQSGSNLRRVARVFVALPDGSRKEFRKDDELHDPLENISGVFRAVDGSRMLWDSNTNTLFMPDGSRYEYVMDGQNIAGRRLVDRNGNKLEFTSATGQTTDTLGRTFASPLSSARQVGDQTYTVPGPGGSALTYTLRWRYLKTPDDDQSVQTGRNILTDQGAELHFPGDRAPGNCAHASTSPYLFQSFDGQPGNNSVLSHGSRFNPVVLWQVGLPDGTDYTFNYNVYGEIDQIIYPTGAAERLYYEAVQSVSDMSGDVELYAQANRGVTAQVVYPNGLQGSAQPWQFTTEIDDTIIPYRLARKVIAPDNSYTVTQYHNSRGADVKYGFDDARAGMPYDERSFTAGGQMLRRKLTEWTYTGPIPPNNNSTATRDARVQREINILPDTGGALAATTTYGYDNDLNVTAVEHYSYVTVDAQTAQFGSIASFSAGTLLRRDETDYLTNDQAYRDRNMTGLPTATRVKEGGNVVAQSEIKYDETALTGYNEIPSWIDPATGVRGNPTTTRRWLDTAGAWLETHAEYDQPGNALKNTDARGKVARAVFASTYAYAYPTNIFSPVPDPTGNNGAPAELVTTAAYDLGTGLTTSVTDANNQTTNYEFSATDAAGQPNPLRRLTKALFPAGGEIGYAYGDAPGNLYVRTLTKQDAATTLNAYKFFDGLGRSVRTQAFVGTNSYTTVDIEYDVLGRVARASNPYLTGLNSTPAPDSRVWTVNSYDALGRVLTGTTPDGAQVKTDYAGARVLVTDQAGKQRLSETDALGRLTSLWEITAQDPTTVAVTLPTGQAAYGYLTSYAYDVLGNLQQVAQDAVRDGQPVQQRRYFAYDSLARLIRARNPEQGTFDPATDAPNFPAVSVPGNDQWSLGYAYDENSNLKRRIDARNVITAYEYDALNRSTTHSYTNDPTQTPTVTQQYDGTGLSASAPNAKGRLTAVSTAGSFVARSTYDNFDALGRVLQSTQTTGGVSYTFPNYSYDLVGHLTAETYPTGRIVATSYDAGGRISGVTGQQTGEANKAYAGSFTYAAHGAVASLQLGNNLYEHTDFNARLQPTQIGLGTTSATASVLQLDYAYGTTNNNGNVQSQTITVPGLANPLLQTYSYDELNRLKTAQETSGGQPSWTQNYKYDRFGNRNFDTGTTLPGLTTLTNPTVDPASNRLTAGEGYLYDPAGNVTQMPAITGGPHAYAYDAESRQISYDTTGATYRYDGDGRRVQKELSGVATVFVYDAAGQLVAEYGGGAVSTNGTSYLTADNLGTPRIITDANGGVRSRHDYLPFGEEVGAGVGGRTTNQGYSVADNVRQKFAGSERDAETNLDFMQARYYSSTMGRFTSVDPMMASAHASNPQTWNRYTYALNNPLKYVDPDGMKPVFRDYKDITEDERRILNNSTVTFGSGKKAVTFSKGQGEALYNYMAKSKTNQLAGFLNQTAGLADIKFSNGRNALSYVQSVSGFTKERVYATVEAGLKTQMETISAKTPTVGVRFIGPEGQAVSHKSGDIDYDVTFRENNPSAAQQLSFDSNSNFTLMDKDTDEHCFDCGDKSSEVGHVLDGALHKVTGGSNPEEIYRRLTERKIYPSYSLAK